MQLAQCWDDGVVDDVRVMEILSKYGAKASFNLNLDLHRPERFSLGNFRDTEKVVWKLSSGELVDVYKGFTVASHTLTHPKLPEIPLEEARREIVGSKDALEQMFGYEIKGFAYPYNMHSPEVQNLVREAGHVYARCGGEATPSYPPENPMAFVPDCHFLSPNFWTSFEKAREADGTFYFWGHSYEIVDENDWQNFEEQIARLTNTPRARWVNLPDLFPTS